jgi:hypothetical protein
VSDQNDIPMLTDLIAKGAEVTLSDLGLAEELEIEDDYAFGDNADIDMPRHDLGATDPFKDNPALEYAIQSILEEHMDRAWQEIKLAIQRELNKPDS